MPYDEETFGDFLVNVFKEGEEPKVNNSHLFNGLTLEEAKIYFTGQMITLANLSEHLAAETGWAGNKILKVNSGATAIEFADDDDINTDENVSNGNLLTALSNLESAGGTANETITIGTDAGDTVSFLGNVTVGGSGSTESALSVLGQDGINDGHGEVKIQGYGQMAWDIRSSGQSKSLSFTDAGTNSSTWLALVMDGTGFTNDSVNQPIVKIENTSSIQGKVTFDAGDLDGSDVCYQFNNGKTEFEHSVEVKGDLTVSGTTTTVNTETINLADNVIVLNSNHTGVPSQDSGITIERGDDGDMSLFWDESEDAWAIGRVESSNEFTKTGYIVMANAQSYSSSQDNAHGFGEVGHIQIDGNNIYIRTA